MIIANGTIEIKSKTSGGIDPATGFPSPGSATWLSPIPCQYKAIKYSNIGTTSQGEHFTIASFSVLIEEQPLQGERLRLRAKDGNELGEYSIIQVEPLEAVGQIRIII